jgi:hypothetical protein
MTRAKPKENILTSTKSVLIVGLQPELIDFSDPEYAAFPGLTAAKVMAGLNAGVQNLSVIGYEARLCLTDFGATAESVLADELKRRAFDCVLIGAGMRTVPQHFLLFEKLINVVHAHAPGAKICFNTNPGDTAQAVERWV